MPRYPVLAAAGPDTTVYDDPVRRQLINRSLDEESGDPYRLMRTGAPGSGDVAAHSFFRDLLVVADSEARARRSLDRAIAVGGRGGLDNGIQAPSVAFPADTVERARARLAAATRDLSTASGGGDVLHPSGLPGWLADLYGMAARQVGTLADKLESHPLNAGMVDTASGAPVLVGVPRLTGGAGVGVQSSQNAAISEVDPATASYSAPVGTVAGLVDVSRQAFEFSKPGLDGVISRDLGRATATILDAQLISGTGSSGQLRGIANVSGILTATTAATTVQGQLSAIWQGFSLASGPTGFGTADASQYLTVMSGRRFAFLSGGSGGTGAQVAPNLPGTVVLTGGIPTNEGAGTNADSVYVVDRSALVLAGGQPTIRVFEEIGSGTLTVRVQCYASAALVVLAPTGIVRISGFPSPSF